MKSLILTATLLFSAVAQASTATSHQVARQLLETRTKQAMNQLYEDFFDEESTHNEDVRMDRMCFTLGGVSAALREFVKTSPNDPTSLQNSKELLQLDLGLGDFCSIRAEDMMSTEEIQKWGGQEFINGAPKVAEKETLWELLNLLILRSR